MLPVKLQKDLFIGDFPLSQIFGNVLIINGVDIYALYGYLGHNGLDYKLPTGTPLKVCINGTVIENAYDADGYGNYIRVENGACGVIYAHMKRRSEYKVGMRVPAGAVVGFSGNTGNSTGPHLHFGAYLKPRNRSNGYGGYDDPFDKTKFIWVDDVNEIPESEALAEKDIIIDGLRKSRNKWKKIANDFSKEKEKWLEAEEIYLKDLEDGGIKIGELINELARFNEDVVSFTLLRKYVEVRLTPAEGVPKDEV